MTRNQEQRPMTEEEHREFRKMLREENEEIRQFLAEQLGKDPEHYPKEERRRY